MEGITGEEIHGCGPSEVSDLRLNVQTTTGGNFSVCVNGQKTVDDVKKLVAKKLKVPKDRICLLHRERQLTEGTLQENGLFDGSRVILLPSVETGLLSQRPENSVMQALENLNDSQVNDFLSGKSPLNLTMRLGDHMMLIQLQLSTLNAAVSGAPGRSRFTSKRANTPSTSTQQREAATRTTVKKADATKNNSETPKEEANTAGTSSESCSFLRSSELETLTDALKLFKRLAAMKETEKEETEKAKKESEEELEDDVCSEASTSSANEQSPIKSLSNLVSSPLKSSMQAFNSDEIDGKDIETMPKYVPLPRSIKNNLVESISNMASNEAVTSQATDTDTLLTDPIAANLTSCLCSTLNPRSTCGWKMLSLANSNKPGCSNQSENTGNEDEDIADSPEVEPMECSYDDSRAPNTICYNNRRQPSTPCLHAESPASPDAPCCNTPAHYNRRLSSMLHNTSKFKHPIGQSKPKVFMQSVVKKHMKKRLQESSADTNTSASSGEPSAIRTRYIHNRKLPLLEQGAQTGSEEISAATQTSPPIAVVTDTKALVEASKNLTQTLKKLSKEVLTTKGGGEGGKEDSVRGKLGPGAVIESMKHHGKGIYSGTFSGTLNPALQDPFGRPKRDISTIIHILNDLLCAGPALTNKDSNATTSSASATTSDGKDSTKTCTRATCTINNCDGRCVLPCLCTGSNTEKTCLCNIEPPKCSACQDSPDDMQCTKCHKAKELAIDNSKTKGKLDRLRLVMQQKKQRREARKSKPYTTAVNTKMAPPENVKEEIDSVA